MSATEELEKIGVSIKGDSGSLTLHQKIELIANKVGKLTPTGKTQFGSAAISIKDIENELRPHFAKNGILTVWSCTGLSPLQDGKLWVIQLEVTLINADSPEEIIVATSADIGNSPAAANSFARKSFYKSLLHIADDSDEGTKPSAVNKKTDNVVVLEQLKKDTNLPLSSLHLRVGDRCPSCEDSGKFGKLRELTYGISEEEKGKFLVCGGKLPNGEWANHKFDLVGSEVPF